MILDHPLTAEEQSRAQGIYYRYHALNALGAGCTTSTLQMLLALQLGFSSAAASVIGPIDYLRYSFLPLGFLLATRFGVCGGKQFSLTATGFLWLVISLSAWSPAWLSGILFFSGIILMNSVLATLWAMEFPLQKNITTASTLPRLLSLSQMISSTVGLLMSLVIAWYLNAKANASFLPYFFCLGALFYMLAGHVISRMPEPSLLRQLASKPLLKETRAAWHSHIVRRQMPVGYVQNMVLATLLPVNVLAAKFATGGSDSLTLVLTTLQTLTIIVSAWLFKVITQRHGPRRMMIATWPAVLLLACYWAVAPVQDSFFWLLPPFILAGFIYIGFSASTGSYFTLSVPNDLQVGGTVLVYIFHGGLVGITGIIANPLIFKLTELFAQPDTMAQYRAYYIIMGLLALPGILVPLKLPEFFGKGNS